jgi:hypothetical protein
VHIDVYAAENGVSRFGEEWASSTVYSKAEGLSPSQIVDNSFNYLIHSEVSPPLTEAYDEIEWAHGFERIRARGALSHLKSRGAKLLMGGPKAWIEFAESLVGTTPKVAILKRKPTR